MTVTQPENMKVAAADASTAVARPMSRRRRWLTRALVYASIAYTSWCTGLYFLQDGLLFPRELAPLPIAGVPRYVHEMSIATEGGQIVPGWFVPTKSAVAGNRGPAVIFFHGNAEIIDYESRVESLWRRLNVSLLLPEYRGYGRAKHAGEPSEASLVADGVRFFDELARRADVDPARIIIHGYSIGGGVAAQVAARRKPAALILESTFTSVASFGWAYGVPPFLARHPFRTDEALADLRVPLFLAHGTADQIIPVEHGRRLHAIVPTSTYMELNCGHMDLPAPGSGDAYIEQIRAFLVRSRILDRDANQ